MATRRCAGRRAPRNSHDSLFRALFDDPDRAADFLRCHLPANILRLLADEPPVLVEGALVDDSLGNHQSDRLLRVRLKSGEDDYIHFLIEHASSQVRNIALRLLRYQLWILERDNQKLDAKSGRLTPIIALVVYNGKARWNASLSIAEMMTGDPALHYQFRDLRYLLIDLGRIPDDQLARHPELEAGLLALKYGTRGPVPCRVLNRIGKLLPEGSILERQIYLYILKEFDADLADLKLALGDKGEEHLGQLAEAFVGEALAKAEAEGRAKGRAEGRAEGQASTLHRQLEYKFGPLPLSVRERVQRASRRELDEWLDAVLDAPTLEAVFRDTPRH